MSKFYVTCAIPYVNAPPHVGHALEFVQGDVITRYHALLGEETKLLSGGDENALKNVQAADLAGVPVKEFIDTNTQNFFDLTKALNCRFDVWQKGSDKKHHFVSSQKLWELCKKDIFKKSYEGLYCTGCEQFYTKDELDENGECFEHPGKKLEMVKEENYFFRLSTYRDQLIKLISDDTIKIIPDFRKNEMLSFLKQPLRDISVSRSNERAKNWGVPVPGDDTQRMYVWFDALNIYQSGIGFGWDEKQYEKWWPADVHVIGKGITRFHAIYWPAFLLSAGLKLPKSIFVHGYFTVNGQKMSKSVGNVIDPFALIEKYGADPLRYYLLREIPSAADGDFSERRFKELYNSDLANGLGNLVARVAKLAEGFNFPPNSSIKFISEIHTTNGAKSTLYKQAFENYQFDEVLKLIWSDIKVADQYINEKQPWKLEGIKREEIIKVGVDAIRYIAIQLQPFLPAISQKIISQFKGPKIKAAAPLFPRIT
ncbi:MAG: methionine--tRNA ligase [Candidatus Gottesmanbacteria bacterium]|nr:methionine--tRNA ligase [Candidatus Gottesmanbacteria bacterium]